MKREYATLEFYMNNIPSGKEKEYAEELYPPVRHSRPSVFSRLASWLTNRFRFRHDAALLAGMSERDLNDIGLYNRDLPHHDAITPQRRRKDFITMDGSILSPNAGDTVRDGLDSPW